ncbi:TolC family protein [[Empedobacter] haloabium]|uniref:TolC family protein n=1 Tax=[Empedobacter] haloabium TaxID=592317 RepID=A0ABZ1UWA8_9BURK
MHTSFILVGATALLMPLCAHAAADLGQQHTSGQAQVAPAPTQDARPLSLAEAIELALAANPGLRSARQDIDIADANRLQAGLLPNPELALLREGMDKGTRTQTVQVSQRLELGGKRAARVALAEGERRIATQDVAIALADLRADVVTTYFDALTAQERLDLAEASLQLAQKVTQAATRRVAAGRISPVEQSRSEVAEAGARLEVAQAVSALGLARQRLLALWAGTGALQRPLEKAPADDIPLPLLETLHRRLDDSPQLRRAHEQVEREQSRVRFERAQRIPDVSVTLGNKRDDEIGRNQAVIGLSVPLPLFNRNQGSELAALRQLEKARIDLDGERLRLTQALSEAYQRARLAQEEVSSLKRDILPAAQRAYEASVTGFELGKFSFLDVIDAQRTLFQTRAQYLRALAERYRAGADIERYVPQRPQQ